MAVNHASLTGASLHEPKGADTAELGQVYIADGNGSGSWTSIAETSFTGQIADFITPVAPTGWLECDGSDINTTTYAALYAAMTIQQTGSRTNSSAIITGLSSTTHMRVGYYVFGTGITSGTTILSIDSATQITLSAAASSSGTSTVVVSPWLLNTGTIRLPNVTAAGRYRRSRASGLDIGDLLSDQNQSHTHSVNGSTGNQSLFHQHQVTGTTGAAGVTIDAVGGHTHNVTAPTSRSIIVNQGTSGSLVTGLWQGVTSEATDTAGAHTPTAQAHTHSSSITSDSENTQHSHSFAVTSGSSGSTESRPTTLVVLTCVKT